MAEEPKHSATSTHSVAVAVKTSSPLPPPRLSAFCEPASAPRKIQKAVLIYNPIGGNKRGKRRAERVVRPMLEGAGVTVVMLPTQHAGHAIELAATCELRGCQALLALGGDGTLSDVATGFLRRCADDSSSSAETSVVLGFLPGGTGNTLLHDIFGVRQRGDAAVRRAVEAVLAGRTRDIDCCRLECVGTDGSTPLVRHSLNIVTAGLGVDANAAAEKRRWMGPIRYDASIFLELMKLKKRPPMPCQLDIDGEATGLDLFVLTIMNNKRSGVGLRISPCAQLDDGKIDVMFTPQPLKAIGTALKLNAMMKGAKAGRHVNDPLVKYTSVQQQIRLSADGCAAPVRIMCDGDLCGFAPMAMTVLPHALTVLTPEVSVPA